MKKILIVLLASLIGMVLCSGVATAQPGDCCTCRDDPGREGQPCECVAAGEQIMCELPVPVGFGGVWVGPDGCVIPECEDCYCDDQGKCVPEITTIALLATGLICMAGYFRLRRKEE